MENIDNSNRNKLAFAAISKQVEDNIPNICERVNNAVDFVICGEDNHLFDYYYECYKYSPTLNSIINGVVDYVIGNSCTVEGYDEDHTVNRKDETLEDVLRKVVLDYLIYGNAAMDVIGNSIYHISMRNLRSNEENTVFYYSENYNKSYGRLKTLIYPKFTPEGDENKHKIIFLKANSDTTYGIPIWASAMNSAVIEREVAEYHLNSLYNGFQPSSIINFNNGVPEDTLKQEIEDNIKEKFAGSANAGRFMLSFNDDADHKTTIDKVETENYADRYNSLISYAKTSLFTAFRAPQILFAIDENSKGFEQTPYQQAFLIFNRSTIKPIQKRLKRALKNSLEIEIVPFSLTEEVTSSDTTVE